MLSLLVHEGAVEQLERPARRRPGRQRLLPLSALVILGLAQADPRQERRWRAVAVDGKVLRGSRRTGERAVWLPAAMDHAGTVLGQRHIDDKSNETPAFVPLLTGLDLKNTVVTADAAHTQHANGARLREQNAHYIAAVKANHPACSVS
ncbi:ISAs1 family transposase [Streptomyces hirsutus]|uniref:ISAs1 family transposase n=1 Tax=Streptomyces hirsutus TaxID=35620 RepID=UPI0036BEE4E0